MNQQNILPISFMLLDQEMPVVKGIIVDNYKNAVISKELYRIFEQDTHGELVNVYLAADSVAVGRIDFSLQKYLFEDKCLGDIDTLSPEMYSFDKYDVYVLGDNVFTIPNVFNISTTKDEIVFTTLNTNSSVGEYHIKIKNLIKFVEVLDKSDPTDLPVNKLKVLLDKNIFYQRLKIDSVSPVMSLLEQLEIYGITELEFGLMLENGHYNTDNVKDIDAIKLYFAQLHLANNKVEIPPSSGIEGIPYPIDAVKDTEEDNGDSDIVVYDGEEELPVNDVAKMSPEEVRSLEEVEMVDPEFYEAHKYDDPDVPLVPLVESQEEELVEDIFEELARGIEELSKLEEENDNVEYIKEYPFHDNLDKVPVEEDHYELLIRKFNELFSLDNDEAISILSDTESDGAVSNGFLFNRVVRQQLLGMFKGYLVSKNIVDTELLVGMPKNDVRMYLERYYYDFKDYITNEFLEVEMVDPDEPLVEAPEEVVEDIFEHYNAILDHLETQLKSAKEEGTEENYYEFLIRKFNELFSLDYDDAINILSDTDGHVSKNGFLFSSIVRAQLLGTFQGYLLSKNIVDRVGVALNLPKNDVRMYLERYYYDFKDYITNGFVSSREVEMVDPEFYEAHKYDDPDESLVEAPEEVVENIFEEYETPSIEELSKFEEENDNYIKEYPFQDNLDQLPLVEDTVEDYFEFLIEKFNELFSLGVDEAINILSDTDGPVSNVFLFSRLVRKRLLCTFKGYLVIKNIVDAELIIDMPKNDVRMYLERYYYDFKDYITNN